MYQRMEIFKALPGVTAEELRRELKAGESAIGQDYLEYMATRGLLGDASFVAELEGGVYLVSYYLFAEDSPKKASYPSDKRPAMDAYQERLMKLFGDAKPLHLEIANSFWIDGVVKRQLG